MLAYLIDTPASEFDNIKAMMKDTLMKKKGKWYSTIDSYRRELNLTWTQLENMNRATLKSTIRQYDTDKWYKGLFKKSSMCFYAMEKKQIGYELCYRNNFSSKIYARARINALQLEVHKGRGLENFNDL